MLGLVPTLAVRILRLEGIFFCFSDMFGLMLRPVGWKITGLVSRDIREQTLSL